ncbi:hypothetical protein RI367_002245 [Sorochytrium milnesiophthora]
MPAKDDDFTTLSATATNVAKWVTAYSTGHVVASLLWRRVLPRQMYRRLPWRSQVFLSEKIMSSINSVVLCIASYRLIFGQESVYDQDTLTPYPPLVHHAMEALFGYTLYDLITMLVQGTEHWSMWLHHCMSAYGSGLMMYYRQAAFYPALFCFSEITALTNNVCWYLDTLRPGSRARVPALLLRAVSFTLCRVWLGPYAVYHTLRASNGDVAQIRQQWAALPRVVSVLTTLNVSLMALINVGWTHQAWKLVLREAGGGRKQKAQ